MAADIDPNHPGVEMWSLDSKGVRNVKGEVIASRVRGLSTNMAVWWDGDLLRELLDRNVVSKYNWEKGLCERIAVFEGALSNNGTKSTPCLQGDIVGDWREEVLLRTADNTALRLYVSTIPTDYRFHTFLEDPFTVSVLRLKMWLIISLLSPDSILVRSCVALYSEDVKYLKSKL